MEKLKRFQELKAKISELGGYFYLNKEEKAEYSDLSKDKECLEWLKGEKKPKAKKEKKLVIEEVVEDVAVDTEEDKAVAEAIGEFEQEEAVALESLTVESFTAETVKNDLWNMIKDGAARAAVLSISTELPLLDELNRIKGDRRITAEGQYVGFVQNYINKLTQSK